MEFFHLSRPSEGCPERMYGKSEWAGMFKLAQWDTETEDALASISCPSNPGHQRAGQRSGQLGVVVEPAAIGDFTWTWYSECLATDSVVTLFKRAGFEGASFQRARVAWSSGRSPQSPPPELFELIVTSRHVRLDHRSGVRRVYECPSCGLVRFSSYRNGLIVDETTWDGADVFTVEEYPQMILVTPRVQTEIVAAGLTNCFLVSTQKMQWPTGVPRPEDSYGLKGSQP